MDQEQVRRASLIWWRRTCSRSRVGIEFARASGLFQSTYEVPPARLDPGTYRSISGNGALALGLVCAARRAGLTLFQGSYPITPASDVLHELSRYKNFEVFDVSGRGRDRGDHLVDRRRLRGRSP